MIQLIHYFDELIETVWGQVYFRVSKHLGCLPSEVIKNKFNPDYKFLIRAYYKEIMAEIEHNEEMEKQMKEGGA